MTTILVVVMVVSLLTVDNVLCFSMPRGIKRVTSKSPFSMNIITELGKIEQDKISEIISLEQDKISLRREELAFEEKKLNQDKEMGVMKLNQDKEMGVMKLNQDKDQRNKELTLKIIVSVFAIISFLTFSVQLKDGLLGQTTTFNSCLKSFSSSFNELKAWICGGLAILTGVVITKPLYNAFSYFNHILRKFVRIILDRVKWRRLT